MGLELEPRRDMQRPSGIAAGNQSGNSGTGNSAFPSPTDAAHADRADSAGSSARRRPGDRAADAADAADPRVADGAGGLDTAPAGPCRSGRARRVDLPPTRDGAAAWGGGTGPAGLAPAPGHAAAAACDRAGGVAGAERRVVAGEQARSRVDVAARGREAPARQGIHDDELHVPLLRQRRWRRRDGRDGGRRRRRRDGRARTVADLRASRALGPPASCGPARTPRPGRRHAHAPRVVEGSVVRSRAIARDTSDIKGVLR